MEYRLKVSNMNCDGCVANIQRALEADANISSFQIELSDKLVTVNSELEEQVVAQIIKDSGYDATPYTDKKGFLSTIFNK